MGGDTEVRDSRRASKVGEQGKPTPAHQPQLPWHTAWGGCGGGFGGEEEKRSWVTEMASKKAPWAGRWTWRCWGHEVAAATARRWWQASADEILWLV